jgi:hypothetical protein
MSHAATPRPLPQARLLSRIIREELRGFVAPLLRTLDQHLDRRFVVTFLETLQALLIWRHRNLGMLLSELGSYLPRLVTPRPVPNVSAICYARPSGRRTCSPAGSGSRPWNGPPPCVRLDKKRC